MTGTSGTPLEQLRQKVVDFLHWELVGPQDQHEVLDEPPTLRYSAGVLFPGGNIVDEIPDAGDGEVSIGEQAPPEDDAEAEEDDSTQQRKPTFGPEDSPDSLLDTPAQLANAHMPSAMGLSFVCRAEAKLEVRVNGAVYERLEEKGEGGRTLWKRKPLEELTQPAAPVALNFTANTDANGKPTVIRQALLPELTADVILRDQGGGKCLVTVAVWNSRQKSTGKRGGADECFFQMGFRVSSDSGERSILEYRLNHQGISDPEEEELALLYRHRRSFAIGHGCAAEWPPSADVVDGRSPWVETAVLPQTKVYALEPRSGTHDLYDMHFLAGKEGTVKPTQILEALKALPDEYGSWLAQRRKEAAGLPGEHKDAATRNLEKCGDCLKRIQGGLDILAQDAQLMRAFMLTNEAMRLQQRPDVRRNIMSPAEHAVDTASSRGRWRVFQLAFLLMNLRSIASGKHDPAGERDLVDLIWFPTGGGKTEAYLGLTAFTIFLRRMRQPEVRGCAVLMRYTLRLLTAQQFERAAALIMACEFIRHRESKLLGRVPVTIGLWAGSSLTPNYREAAIQNLTAWIKDEDKSHNFQLLKCPWCKCQLDDRSNRGYHRTKVNGVMTVKFFCPDQRCPGSREKAPVVGIPACVIDEDIYEEPPTLLLGTVDKFAMLAWNPRAGVLLRGDGADIHGPDLIIQDELHLISGPLGTIVGLYEAVIDRLCSQNRPPKIVASTATIRRAGEQCLSLFDRSTVVFPPAALSMTDSWFAKEKTDAPGRLYVGVLGSAAPSFTTLSRQAIASLSFGISWMDLPAGLEPSSRDAYWTLVWYFNSLRELGRGGTLVEADVREHLGVIRRRLGLSKDTGRPFLRAEELTSRKRGDEIPKVLERLEHGRAGDSSAIDVLLATNMISVGVDVPRLGLMAVAGQPKSTSEYIQATSRVGRDDKQAPGLVVPLYVPGKSRDRSHYEHFRTYHESFYRFVEPTSVTPYSIPAIDRALHALIVIVARQEMGCSKPADLKPSDPWPAKMKSWLVERAKRAGTLPRYIQALVTRFDLIIQIWTNRPDRAEWGEAWMTKDESDHLLYPPSAVQAYKEGLGAPSFDVPFPTPTSMRNVDVECRLRIRPNYASHLTPENADGEEMATDQG